MGNEQIFPYGEFKRLKNVDGFDGDSVSEDGPLGYILEVDLECPEESNVLHDYYRLAPEKLTVPYDMLYME